MAERPGLRERRLLQAAALPPAVRRGRRRERRDWAVDGALFAAAALFGGFTQAYLWADHGRALDDLDVALGTLACLALWARRSRPVEAFVVAFAAASVSPLALGAGLVMIFNAALRVRGRALAALAALAVVGSIVFPLVNPKAGEVVKTAFPAFLLTVIAFGSGLYVRARRELEGSLRQRADQLEADQERSVEAAREAERRRIAREMHDVLAHRLSLLSIHAGALQFRPGAPPEEIAQAASVVRASAVAALEELRQVISVLREDDLQGSGPPQPALAQLPALLEESRAAGMAVRAHIDTAGLASLPEALGRTAYRVVQEGLTNSRKHAPGSPVEVTVSANGTAALVVEVVNAPGAAVSPVGLRRHEGGAGLVGLGERLALVGGALEHGQTNDGGYMLRAAVPRRP
jgi:signal transduction histidine kinase